MSSATRLQTVTVNTATSGDNTIYTPNSGMVFTVYNVLLSNGSSTDVTWVFKSGSTEVGRFASIVAAKVQSPIMEMTSEEAPLLIGRAKGDALVLNLSGNVQTSGFVVVGETFIRGEHR